MNITNIHFGTYPIGASELFVGFICNCLSYFMTARITFTCNSDFVDEARHFGIVPWWLLKDKPREFTQGEIFFLP